MSGTNACYGAMLFRTNSNGSAVTLNSPRSG